MTRSVALRASVLFIFFAAAFAFVGLASHVELAEALFLISTSVCIPLLLFAAAVPVRAPVPARIRRIRR